MPRRPRDEAPGAFHHVFNRGAKKHLIYVDEFDCLRYLVWLGRVVDKYRWELFAYSLMRNHVHLVVRTPEPNLGRGMQMLHGEYASAFNERHATSGCVFQGRFENRRIVSDEQLHRTVHYVDDNPVKAKLCKRPEDWRWGSRHAVASGAPPRWLAHERWQEHVDAMFGPTTTTTPRTGAPVKEQE